MNEVKDSRCGNVDRFHAVYPTTVDALAIALYDPRRFNFVLLQIKDIDLYRNNLLHMNFSLALGYWSA